MTVLLDVNVLIALLDARHSHHDIAHEWFDRHDSDWATCPITENGFIRIVSGPTYGDRSGSPSTAAATLADLVRRGGHSFWEDRVSLLTSPIVEISALMTSKQVTDTYLLALAVERGGELATFDRRLSTRAVVGGDAALHIIPSR